MKTFITTLLLLIGTGLSYSQSTYNIVNVGSSYTPEMLQVAMNNAELCGYFYQGHVRTLHFDDGSIVELKKSEDIPNLDASCVINDPTAVDVFTWSVSNGVLLFSQPSEFTPSHKEYNHN